MWPDQNMLLAIGAMSVVACAIASFILWQEGR